MNNNKIDMPWSIKGVSLEARTLAKAAAAREGLTMGEWVSRAIRRRGHLAAAVPTAAVADQPAVQTATPDAINAHVQQQILALETRMVNLAKPLDDVITQMAHRIDDLEARLAEVADTPEADCDT